MNGVSYSASGSWDCLRFSSLAPAETDISDMEPSMSASGVLGCAVTSVLCATDGECPSDWTADDSADSAKEVAKGERLVGTVSVHLEIAESAKPEVSKSRVQWFA